MSAATWEWWVLVGLVLGTFFLDGLIVDRRPHAFGHREAGLWVGVYVLLAGAVAAWIWVRHGSAYGGQFIAGYLTEYSLSIDNLFVFLVLMGSFAVPVTARHRVLRIGVALSLLLRGGLIVIGAAAVEQFEATLFLFAALLAWTAVGVWRNTDAEPDPEGNAVVRWLERRVPVTRDYHGHALTATRDGRRVATPMLLVILAIGVSNVLFAVDSIPAIFGLTTDPFIIVASNAFALMGLRQVFFLLHGLMDRLTHMSKGLAVVLGFIAVKLALEAAAGTFHAPVPVIDTWTGLGVILLVLTATVVASAVTARRQSAQHRETFEPMPQEGRPGHSHDGFIEREPATEPSPGERGSDD